MGKRGSQRARAPGFPKTDEDANEILVRETLRRKPRVGGPSFHGTDRVSLLMFTNIKITHQTGVCPGPRTLLHSTRPSAVCQVRNPRSSGPFPARRADVRLCVPEALRGSPRAKGLGGRLGRRAGGRSRAVPGSHSCLLSCVVFSWYFYNLSNFIFLFLYFLIF